MPGTSADVLLLVVEELTSGNMQPLPMQTRSAALSARGNK
jgi:hypothetical protein